MTLSSARLSFQYWMALHPRTAQAARTAVAVALAWVLVRQLGGVAEEYPYYAPMGAVVAVTNTVASSLREGLQSVLAIMIGAGLATAVHALEAPPIVALAVVVGLGTVLGGLPYVRNVASWVPVSGLFVLLVGGSDPVHYPLAYFGLTALGAAVGIAVILLAPPLPVLRTEVTERRVRHLLADQLDDLVDGLLSGHELDADDWARRLHDVRPHVHELESMLDELSDAARANWRLRHWHEATQHQYEQARALHQLVLLVEDVTALITHRGHVLHIGTEAGDSLIEPAGRALREMASLLRSLNGPTAEREPLERTDSAVQALATAIRENDAGSRRDGFAAASIVTSVRRAVASLTPDELADRFPSQW